MSRAQPHAIVRLYSGHGGKATVYPGFGRDDPMRELFDRKDTMGENGTSAVNKIGSQMVRVSKAAITESVRSPYGSSDQGSPPDGVIYIPQPFGQVRLLPLIDLTQDIDLNYFEPIGKWTVDGHNDFWFDGLRIPGLSNLRLIHMRNSTPLSEGEYTGVRSRFNVPWNAVMCFLLTRTDPPDADATIGYTLSPYNDGPLSGDMMTVIEGSDLPSPGTEVSITVTVSQTDESGYREWDETHTAVITYVEWVDGSLAPPNGGYVIHWSPVLPGVPKTMTWGTEVVPPKNYWTRFYFGTTTNRGFCLEIPYDAAVRLWMRDEHYTGNKWQLLHPEREIAVSDLNFGTTTLRAARDLDYRFIWVAFTGLGIAVSTDGFSSAIGFWSTRVAGVSSDHPQGLYLDVPRAPVEFRHNAGEWGIAWVPINHPTFATIDGPVFHLPYPYDEYVSSATATHRYAPVFSWQGLLARDKDGAKIGSSIQISTTNGEPWSRVPADGRGVEWRVTLTGQRQGDEFNAAGRVSGAQIEERIIPAGTPVTYYHAVSPELHTVRFHAWSGISDSITGEAIGGDPDAGEEIEAIAVRVSRNERDIGSTGDITLDDMPSSEYPYGRLRSEFYSSYRPRLIKKWGQWLDNGGNPVAGSSASIFTGEAAIPTIGMTGPGAVHVVSELQDSTIRAIEGVSDGRTPPFDLWPVRTAVMWILDQMGVPFNPDDIEDTGLYLNLPLPGNDPYWYAEDGRSWRDLLKEICLYDYGAAIWINEDGYAEKGCPYCRTQRDAVSVVGDTAASHSVGGWQSSGCFSQDVIRSGNAYGVDYWLITGAAYRTGYMDTMTCEIQEWQFEGVAIEEEYFNHTRIKGAKRLGKDDPITLDFVDWASIHGITGVCRLGYFKTQTYTFEWADQVSHLARVGKVLHARHSSAPAYLRVKVPFLPQVRIGHVAAVYGLGLEFPGLSGQRWRIVGYSHDVRRGQSPASTTLRLRYIGAVS